MCKLHLDSTFKDTAQTTTEQTFSPVELPERLIRKMEEWQRKGMPEGGPKGPHPFAGAIKWGT